MLSGGASFDAATELPLNKTNTFTLQESRYDYYYKFTLTHDGYINFPFKMSDEKYGPDDIFVYNSSREKIWDLNVSMIIHYTRDYSDEKYGLPAGTYYLFVKAGYEENATFRMRLNFTESDVWETKPNNKFETADPVSLNKAYYGSFNDDRSDDYFKFYVPSTAYVNFACMSTYFLDVEIYSSDLLPVGDWSMYSEEQLTVDEDAHFFLTKGTYYMRMYYEHGQSGEYSFKVNSTNLTKKLCIVFITGGRASIFTLLRMMRKLSSLRLAGRMRVLAGIRI